MEEKNNKGLIWLIVILSILVLGLIGFILYDKSHVKSSNENNIITTTDNVETTTSNKKISKEEVEKYLSYVPFEYNSQVMYCTWKNDEECNNEIKYFDAYSEEKVSIKDINDELLLRMAIYKTKDVSSTESFESNFSICGEEETCILDEYYKGEAVRNKVYEMYNKNVDLKEFSVGGGYAYYKNGYYAIGHGAGNYPPTKLNKIINYEISNKDLVIVEQAIFIYDMASKTDEIDITKATNYDNEDILKTFFYNLCAENNNCDSISKKYAEDNLNNSNKFKHTFKLNTNGTYYWYSTELVNN